MHISGENVSPTTIFSGVLTLLKAMSDKVYELIPRSSRVERIATGFRFTEGPVWERKSSSLLFSDILGNTLYRWTSGSVAVERCPSRMSNGLALDRLGNVIACEHAGRQVSIGKPGEKGNTLVNNYDGKKLNSPNDVVMKSDGSIYFTDPTFGLTADFGVLAEQELKFQGLYRVSPDGQLTVLMDDFVQPNGLAFSPDESKLYVDDSERQHIRVFDVQKDGTLSNNQVFATLDINQGAGVADGMKVDLLGNVFVTGPGGINIFDPSGTLLGVLALPEIPANLTWGGEDGKTLFITAQTSVYRIHTAVSGALSLH